jgi:hypothetical protein
VLANIQDNVSLHVAQYIVKAWGPEFPELALNEVICMSALKAAGLPVTNMYLSDDRLYSKRLARIIAERIQKMVFKIATSSICKTTSFASSKTDLSA